ncbi:metallopeptidase MepB [Xylariales sp. PMI_506]|nr:metallopeptidase MepB [Xylariales sp. PMI_506]
MASTVMPPQPPPEFNATAESVLSDAKGIIEKTQKLHASLVQDVLPDTATFENVLLALARAENDLITSTRFLSAYNSISEDAGVREASAEAKNLFEAFKTETAMNEPLFRLVDAVLKAQSKPGQDNLDDESRRYLEKVHREFTVNGLSLPSGSPERRRFKEIKTRISQLEGEFLKVQTTAKSADVGVSLTREELDGVPESVLSKLEKSEKDGTESLRVTFNNPVLFPTLRNAKNEATRKRLYVESDNACAACVPILKEVAVLRDEAARLLGYPNHATFRLQDKMAKDPETVNKFLGDLRDGLAGKAAGEIAQKRQLKREDVEAREAQSDGGYFLWDDTYYHSIAMKKFHAVDQQYISEYFPLDAVMAIMLDMMQKLFGFRMVEVSGDDIKGKVWNEDVRMFRVWNTEGLGGRFSGYLYLDVFERDGKAGHPHSLSIIPGFHGQEPATALVCSLPKPSAQQPTLLRHVEVVTLFHELGHCIHDLASKRTVFALLNGPEATALDFCEAPSQLLEYWFWTPPILRAIGRHYSYLSTENLDIWKKEKKDGQEQPPETLPEEVIEQLVGSKNKFTTLANLRQVAIGCFDMALHTPASHEAIEALHLESTYNRLRRDILQLQDPSDLGEGDGWGCGFALYPHLVDGYDAGFYGYLFSRVYAADIFYAKFASDPMNAEEGIRYRKEVLEKGGIYSELDILTEYLGRRPTVEAFNREIGLE